MKNIIYTAVALALLAFLPACQNNPNITQVEDYEYYLDPTHHQDAVEELNSQMEFWENKLRDNPSNQVFEESLAGYCATAFRLTGNMRFLNHSDSLLLSIHSRFPNQVSVLQALSANAVSRHAFGKAEEYIRNAWEIGDNRFASSLMLTDVLLEQGQRPEAEQLLDQLAAENHFDYLIRKVRILDEQGDLDAAVNTMEEAASLAEKSGRPSIQNWALSNLADMYGHQGKVRKSYHTYLQALKIKPADLHSLKGIAWIAFSYEEDGAEARRILEFLQSLHPVPDYQLLLAEIARFEGKEEEARALEQTFVQQASQPAYRQMYQPYLCELAKPGKEALAMARREVEERPHPMSYDLLAWTLFRNDQPEEALQVLTEHVVGKTEEPLALYHSGIILKETGEMEKGTYLLAEALSASFELGPLMENEIRNHLSR